MIFFSTPSRGQQVLTPLGSAQTTSLLVVLICFKKFSIDLSMLPSYQFICLLSWETGKGASEESSEAPWGLRGIRKLLATAAAAIIASATVVAVTAVAAAAAAQNED